MYEIHIKIKSEYIHESPQQKDLHIDALERLKQEIISAIAQLGRRYVIGQLQVESELVETQ